MKRVWWLIVAAITAAMVLTYLLSQRHAEAAPAKAAASAKQAAPAPIPNPPGLLAFYPRVLAFAAKPPAESALRAVADWRHEDGACVTLLAASAQKRALLALFTPDKIKNPEKGLYLTPRYIVAKDMKAVAEGREPMVRTSAGNLVDWAYVFDRNRDGRADYLCHLVGPLPVEPDSFPADFPLGSGPLAGRQLDYMLDHQRYVFTHAADENFDGAIDALVVPVLDSDRPWVKSFAVILAPGGGTPDSAWTFRGSVTEPTGALERARGGYIRHRVAGKEIAITSSNFEKWSDTLARVNAAAVLKKSRFSMGP